MAALANLSFETAGASAGLAADWTASDASSCEVVDFSGGTGNPRSVEDYRHGWPGNPLVVGITGTTITFSADLISPPLDVEDYARWKTPFFRTELTGGTAVSFDGALTTEEYGYGWPGDPYEDAISGSPLLEDEYDTGWPGDPYVTTISGGTAIAFDTPSGTSTVEDYDDTFADVPFAVDLANNRFVCQSAHGLTSNQRGEVLSTGKRPGGTPSGVYLYVIVVSPTVFQVSLASGPGTAVTLTDVGFGEHRFKADRTKYWTEVS
jgi:hypothetical protein